MFLTTNTNPNPANQSREPILLISCPKYTVPTFAYLLVLFCLDWKIFGHVWKYNRLPELMELLTTTQFKYTQEEQT